MSRVAMSKRATITAALCLAVAGAGVAAITAGFGGGPATVSAGRPAQPPASAAPVAGTAAAQTPGATPGRPAGTLADNSKGRAASPGASAHAGGRGGTTTPRWGIYVDARAAAAPHYVLSVARTGPGVIKGAVNYLYPGGATFVGQYTGTVSRDGRVTMRFGAGTAAAGAMVAGSYRDGHLILASCASVLRRAAKAGDCTFTYNGNVSD